MPSLAFNPRGWLHQATLCHGHLKAHCLMESNCKILQIPRMATSPVPRFSLAPSPLMSHPVAQLICSSLNNALSCFCAFYTCSFLCLDCSLPQPPGKFLLTFKMWLRYCLLLHASHGTSVLCAESHPILCHLNLAT